MLGFYEVLSCEFSRMKRVKSEAPNGRRYKLSHFLFGISALYLIFIAFRLPHFLEGAASLGGDDTDVGLDGKFVGETKDAEFNGHLFSVNKYAFHQKLEGNEKDAPPMPSKGPMEDEKGGMHRQFIKPLHHGYGRITGDILRRRYGTSKVSVLEKMADEAWKLGSKAWEEVDKVNVKEIGHTSMNEGKPESCPLSLTVSGEELGSGDGLIFLPCGLAAGSSITVVGTPHNAHKEFVPQLARLRLGAGTAMISQFVVELQGLKSVDGEDPPKILHLNPRLKGDWSHQPVIEHNTCYRMQWGTAHRCDGLPSKNDEDVLVDGYRRCEKWMRNDIADPKESKTASWFQRFVGRKQKPEVTWPFPFAEGRLFVLTLRAGIDGFHINVGGRHVTSFLYRTGFSLEDATGLAIKGDMDVHSVYATSLPSSHPSFSPVRVLEMTSQWKAPLLPKSPIKLFIGVLSATNHFAERMAARKTWMQSSMIRSSDVVARFFVALNPRKEVNAVLKEEAVYFGDIVIIPFMDRYELVVLKTIAISEFGVQNVTAAYIMKCDDDTFVRVDTILKQIERISPRKSLYMGNLNLFHRPLRFGKWAVSFEEWPEALYPPYANGPGYIISNDIAKFIVSQHANKTLRLFKMEDVSMGMWVEQYNSSVVPVQYSHSWKFCQHGCVQDYYTAHYQSPRQMICLWDKLARGQAHCCNFR